MTNQSRERRPSPPPKPAPSVWSEPEVRRWPHPTEDAPAEKPDLAAALHFIHCSLSYQNQLLSEIRTLLEAQAAEHVETPEGK